MKRKAAKTIQQGPAPVTISHCQFINEPAIVSPQVCEAVTALAKALEAAANALRGPADHRVGIVMEQAKD
jgi:hypothetical protein